MSTKFKDLLQTGFSILFEVGTVIQTALIADTVSCFSHQRFFRRCQNYESFPPITMTATRNEGGLFANRASLPVLAIPWKH